MEDSQLELFEVSPTLKASSKICYKCGERKALEEFHKNSSAVDGRQNKCKSCSCAYSKNKYNELNVRLSKVIINAKKRAKKYSLPFNIDAEYLESIITDTCPVFGIKLHWDVSGEGITNNSPSLDRIIPELGYVRHNVVFLSNLANAIKQDVTEIELYKVADWLHEKRKEVLRAIKEQPAPVPVEHTGESADNFELRPVHGAGPREDCDGAHHHRGEQEGDDSGDSTKAGCRICLGARGKQVEALELYENCESYGLAEGEIERLAKCFGCVCYQR